MATAQPIYRVGERVDGLYDENTDDMWYPGRIRCVHLGGAEADSAEDPTFEVLYDDGEVEMHVRPEFLRQHVSGTICVGTRVLCRYDGGEEYYPGQVSDVQENGRYTIAYDDGEVEEDVPLDHILEPKEEEEVGAAAADAGGEDQDEEEGEEAPNQPTDDDASEKEQQQQEEDEDAEMEEAQDSPGNPVDEASRGAGEARDDEESVNGDVKSDEAVISEPLAHFDQPRPEHSQHNEAFRPTRQEEDVSDPAPAGVSAERAYIIESLQLLEKRLGDASSTKSVLSALVKQMRAYPQVTADLVHERGGERLVIDALKFHQSHAVIQCYGCVLLRRLCFLCVKSTHYLLRNGIVELVIQAMNAFAEDAILQASACGALAVFTRVHSGLNILIEYQVAQLVLSTLIYHKTYSVHTRQVHYYACEVLLELCELDDLQTLNMLCGEQEEEFTGDMSPISLLLFLLRQGLSLDDKKACCAVGSLLMCLAASGKRAAALILGLNGIAELSTVMARYPTEPSIQKYSAAASKQIALCSVRQSPTKRIKDTATEILREAESLEHTPTDRQPTKKSSLRGRSTSIGKRKSNPVSSYGTLSYPRGAAHTSRTPYRNAQDYSKASSPFGQGTSGYGGDMSTFGYPGRDFPGAATAPQQPSSLVILDGSLGADSGYGSTNKRKQQLSKEDRQSELFDAYGIQGVPSSANSRPYGTKRAQLRAHLASAESAWAPPQQHTPSTSKPYSSRSEYLDHGPAYSHRDFMSSRQNRWDEIDEPQHAVYDPELKQPRGAKRKKKNPAPRTAFQVKIENENQLRVSRETRSPYPSPQRLGAATKRAAKARQKRITAGGYSAISGRSNNASSESLNDYATQLFQDNVSRGTGIPTSSKLTPREKEEIRERERLSFAEKLHKMIDKAKSTLANGNTTSTPAADHSTRQQKSSASSKTARKLREPSTTPSDDKRPFSKKPRPVVNSTPKYAAKEVLSPRESTETRPVKPTSGSSKRQPTPNEGHQTPSGHQASARTKPIAPRPIVFPKTTAEQKPRSVVKSNKVPAAKFAEAERAKEPVTTAVSAEVASASTPVSDEPTQVDSDAVAEMESPENSDAVHVQIDTAATQQVEPTISSSSEAATIEVESVVSSSPTELTEVVGPAVHESESTSETNVPGEGGAAAEETVATPTPSETEITASPVDAPLPPQKEAMSDAATNKAETELSDTSANLPLTSVSPSEESTAMPEPIEGQPSGGSATVDAMYGDAFSEFDDNGGDDEDITAEAGLDIDDPQIPAAEPSDSPKEVPLQESKSGEALYDDGYDEFDEDDTTNAEEVDVEDAPPAGGDSDLAAEVTDVISSDPLDGDSDQAATVIEREVSDTPLVAPENSSTESSKMEAESATLGGNVEGNAEDDGNGGDTVNEPEELQEPQTEAADVADAVNEAHYEPPSDPDVLECTTAEEENGNTHLDLENDLVPDSSDKSIVEGEHSTAVEGDTAGMNGASDGVVEADNPGSVGEHAVLLDSEAGTSTSVAELTVTENAIGDTEPGMHSAAVDNEAPATDLLAEPADLSDPTAEDVLVDVAQLQQKEGESVDVAEIETKLLLAGNSASSLQQDGEESKNLSTDSSAVSIQSAAYDEENFDEENQDDEEPSEAVNAISSDVSPVEEVAEIAGEVVDPEQEQEQEQGGKNLPVSETEVDAGTANGLATNANQDAEEESKELMANSSELSMQSAAYEDDEFDYGVHEETVKAEPEEQSPDQEQNVDQDTGDGVSDASVPADVAPTAPEAEKEEPNSLDSEDPSDPVISGNKDFGSAAPSEPTNENTIEPSDTEMAGEPSELQQLENSDSTGASDSGAVAEAPAVENDAPAAAYQGEAADEEPTVDESSKYDDDPQMENLGEITNENVTKSDDPTSECPVEEALDAVESATETFATKESPEITIPADELTPDTNAHPATYDDDDFDNGGDEEASASVVAQNSEPVSTGEQGPKDDDELDVQSPSGQVSDEAGGSPSTEANAIDESVVDPSEPESLIGDQQEQPAIEAELAPVAADETAPSDIVGAPELEAKSELDPAVSSGEVGDLVPSDESSRVSMEMTPTEPEIVSFAEPDLQTAIASEQVEEKESFQGEQEETAVSECAGDLVPAEETPQPKLESTNLVDPKESDVAVETPIEPNVEVATEDVVAEQASEYTQGGGEFDEEPDPVPADTAAMVENSAEPSEEAAHVEDQYGDATFDEVENDTAALKDVASEIALVQVGPGETEEISTADVVNTAPEVSDASAEPEIDANVDPDIIFDAQVEQGSPEPSEATADITGDQEVGGSDQSSDDTTPEATGNADDYPGDNTTTAPALNSQDALPLSSPDDAASEDDLLPGTSPGANEEVSVTTSAFLEEAINNEDKAGVDSDTRIESAANDKPLASANESPEPSAAVDTVPVSPQNDEGYDEGFDEDVIADSSDPVDPTPSTEDATVPEKNVSLESPGDTVVVESDQLMDGDDGPNAAEKVAQAEVEVKPEDYDTTNSVDVEPPEGAVGSDTVAPEASEAEAAIPEASETDTVEMVESDATAGSNDDETKSMEPKVAELAVESDIANESIQYQAPEPQTIETEAVVATEPEAAVGEEPEAFEPVLEIEKPQAVGTETIETAAPEAARPEAVMSEASESFEPEVLSVEEPQAIEAETMVTVAPEVAEAEAMVGEEPEAFEPEVLAAEEAKAVEPEAAEVVVAAEPEVVEPEAAKSELAEVNVGELKATEIVALDAETADVAAAEPSGNGSELVEKKEPVIEATESGAAPEDSKQSEDVGSPPTTDSTPASEIPLENTSVESPPEGATIPDAIKDEVSPEALEVPAATDLAIGDSDNLSTEAAVDDEGSAVEAINAPTSIGGNEDASEIKGDDGCEASSEEIKADVPLVEEDVDPSTSAAPVVEDPTEMTATEEPGRVEHEGGLEADTPTSATSPAIQENADEPEPIYTDDVDTNDDQEALDAVQNTSELAANGTSEKEEQVPEAAYPEPTEPVAVVPDEAQPVVAEQTPVQADDYDADLPMDEAPASPLVEVVPADTAQAEAVEEEAPSTQSFPAEALPEDVDVLEPPEKIAVEAVESPPDEIAVESPAVAASEGPATEDQYDDEDGYNDFDDQENDVTAPEPAPSVEIPAPSAAVTGAPATEDDYEEYENEDYGEEEKPAADSVPQTSARTEPPPSAREEEIEEVADEPEDAEEEAYGNDPDDYNNEFEDDDTPAPASKANSPKKDKPAAAADASADEYEDDAEDEYADDEVEESSPKAAPPQRAAPATATAANSSSDDEMEEELGSDYADSDG